METTRHGSSRLFAPAVGFQMVFREWGGRGGTAGSPDALFCSFGGVLIDGLFLNNHELGRGRTDGFHPGNWLKFYRAKERPSVSILLHHFTLIFAHSFVDIVLCSAGYETYRVFYKACSFIDYNLIYILFYNLYIVIQ